VNVALKSARREDLPILMRYVHAFRRLEQRPFNLYRTEQAFLPLLTSAEQGRVWIIEAGGRPVGYLALCYGYSLHAGGREALIDGFFVEEEFRNRGIGAGVLRQVLGEARTAGIVAVHVRPGAAADRARRLLTAAGLKCAEPVPMLSADLAPGQ
jgi:GNAT superfamily N-acetyltransferase